MIDPQLLRDAPDVIKTSQRARGESESLVDDAVAADAARRSAIASFEELRAEQNAFGKTVAKAPKEEKAGLVAQAQQLAAKVKEAQAASTEADTAFDKAVRSLGNVVVDGVPAGGEENFATLREVGTRPSFDFEPLDHADLGEKLGAIDIKRGTKVSGSRFYFLRGIGARLELALMNMALDKAITNDFTPLITPTLVRPEIMAGTGFLGSHSDEVYHLPADDLYLTGTSEVALAGYHSDEILDVTAGPIRYAGWSTCYRREAGAAGKDNRGILRVHQFNKVEMFIYTTVEEAAAEHERLLAWEEEMLAKCELPYRVIDTAAGDLGNSAARKFDCEAWVPTQGAYRELTSTSNCTTFQARRLNIRERVLNEDGAPKGTRAVATLNGTLATTRWIVAILEHHQNEDGSVNVPKALQKYLGGMEVLPVL